MKKVKLFAAAALVSLLSISAVAVISATRGSSMIFAEGCEHEGNHYAATASLDAAGNKEYWVCCKCHEHFFVEPTGNWEVQVLEETLAPTDDRYIAPQRDYVERMASLPAVTEFNPDLKAKKEADFLTAYYETLPDVAKALYTEASVADANAKKAIYDTMHFGGLGYQWNKSHWFYDVSKDAPAGTEKSTVAVPSTDPVYGNYMRINISATVEPWVNAIYASTVIGNNAEQRLEARNRQGFVDDDSIAGALMVRVSRPGKYNIQCSGVDNYFTMNAADTWQSVPLSNKVVERIKAFPDGVSLGFKPISITLQDGDYFEVSDIVGITDPASGCTATYTASNSWNNGTALGTKVNRYVGGSDVASLLTNVNTPATTTKLVDYSYRVVDETTLSSSSICFQSDDLIAETGTISKLVLPIYVSESTKMQVKDHASYSLLVNKTLSAGWNFVEYTNASVIANIIAKQDKTLLYYPSECHNGTLIYIGAPRAAVTPAAAAE